jgi:hypothetical protein
LRPAPGLALIHLRRTAGIVALEVLCGHRDPAAYLRII